MQSDVEATKVGSGRAYQVQTVDRAIQVLRTLLEHRTEMGVTEIARELGLYPSTVSRILATLADHSFVSKSPTSSKYYLGLGILEFGSAVLERMELREIARPVLEELAAMSRETIFLMVMDRGEGVYIDRIDSPQTVAIQSMVGRREPVHCSGVGKAMLAHLDESEVDWVIREKGLPRRTPQTITDPEILKAHLAQIRRRGFALDNEEGETGIRCVAAPIFDHRGRPVAAASIAAPSYRCSLEQLEMWAPRVMEGTASISRHLGYRSSSA